MDKYLIERIALANDNRTRSKLESIFLLPKVLAKVLESSPVEITDISKAKFYLLSKWQDIAPAMTGDKNQSLTALNKFVASWLISRQVVSRISFNSGCSIKEDCTTVWLPTVKELSVAKSDLLKNSRNNYLRYLENFDLVEATDGFFVEIPFEPKKTQIVKTDVPLGHSKQKKESKNTSSFGTGISASDWLDELERALEQRDNETARAYRTSSFHNTFISCNNGYVMKVQGGLPSLGKNK